MKQMFIADKRYVNLPVTEYGKTCEISLFVEGVLTTKFRVKLALDQPDYWVVCDIARFKGKNIRFEISGYLASDNPFDKMILSDKREGREHIYHEDLRPKFHYSSICGWLNDPNGLLYYKDKWFLFAQLNPYYQWCDNMHWYHATSKDLFSWKDYGPVLFADHISQKYSGSGIVDEDNVSGLKCTDDAPILLYYTDTGYHCQNLAYSVDGGKTWRDYELNPVLPEITRINRDPKVIKSPEGNGYLMALYMKDNDFCIFSSKDLLHWEKTDELTLKGCAECPDIYEIALDGDDNNKRTVFSCAGGQYLVGKMANGRFEAETELQKCFCGNDVYAPQSFFGAPENRRVQIICSSNSAMIKGECFGKFLTLPCELVLKTVDGKMKLCSAPARELRNFETEFFSEEALEIQPTEIPVPNSRLFRAEFLIDASFEGVLEIKVFNLGFVCNMKEHTIEYKGEKFKFSPCKQEITFDLVVDRCSAELFVNDGELYIPAVAPLDYCRPPFWIYTQDKLKIKNLRISEIANLLPWDEL